MFKKQAWTAGPHGLDSDATRAWQDAVLAHRSQIDGFWTAVEGQMRREIAEHARSASGARLWHPPATNRPAGSAARALNPVREQGLSFCLLSDGRRPEKLQRLVESIYRQRLPAFEVIVCGDAKRSPLYRIAEAADEASSGAVSVLRNRAAELARFDFIVFCDDDMVLDRNWYGGLRPYLGSYDLLTTRILNPDGTRYWDWAVYREPGKQHMLCYGEIDRDLYLTGGVMVVRTAVWRRHPWDEDLVIRQAEDVEFSQRIIGAGHRAGICTESAAVHDDDRHTQVGRSVFSRSERGIVRHRDRELEAVPTSSLAVNAVRELVNGEVADAVDCLRAWRVREPRHPIAVELLQSIYHLHGGNIGGNDDWHMSPSGGRCSTLQDGAPSPRVRSRDLSAPAVESESSHHAK